jgi:hypothetical protein
MALRCTIEKKIFDLIQPRGVDGEMDQPGVRVGVSHSLHGRFAGVAGAVIHDPIHAAGGAVRLDGHDLVHEPVKRDDPGRLLDAIKQVGVVHVPRGQIRQRSAAEVLKLDQSRATRPGRDGRVFATERLQLGLLIGADDVLVRA